ncbi:cytochrome P450 [Micromonospora sp. WMMD812]|uniref:cytochrome P450 n=1 Tax=Micromonospora sp. WMMD812 TaxID=3015152 RepID=UPI00248BC282|nr:cytochrome P450 [Micromonospora sp. WMMD812]WBB68996.1 cytochrome P450 [Micromonospora sp. WMMD812]
MTATWPVLAPASDTPPCGPPRPHPDTGWTLTRYADVRAALVEPSCRVPVAEPGPPGTLAGLRGAVSRFSAPAEHPRRRDVGVAALATLDPDALREHASRLSGAALDSAGGRLDVAGALARCVPVRVLAARLGFADPDAAVPAVAAVAAAYHPGAEPAVVRRADRAVAALVALAPPDPFEALANRIGLLVQACDATAGLICAGARHLLPPAEAPATPRAHPALGRHLLPPPGAPATPRAHPGGDAARAGGGTAPTGPDADAVPAASGGDLVDLLAEVLRLDPPVRGSRRITAGDVRIGGVELPAGTPLVLRFDAANRDPAVFAEPDVFRPGRAAAALTFGVGPRGCPGSGHALALAAGVLDVLRERCRRVPGPVRYEPHPLLRVPTRLEVVAR